MSIVLNIEQICAKAKKGGYVFCQLYEHHTEKQPTDRDPFDTIFAKDTDGFLAELKQFASTYPGTFTGVFKSSKESQKKHIVKLRFARESVESVPASSGVDLGAFRAELAESIRAEVRQEQEQERLRQELEESKKELANFQMNGGKLAYALERFIVGYLFPKERAAETQLQGFDDLDEQQIDQLEQAFAILLEGLGYETIIKLAQKFEAGEADNVIPIVQNFAKS